MGLSWGCKGIVRIIVGLYKDQEGMLGLYRDNGCYLGVI